MKNQFANWKNCNTHDLFLQLGDSHFAVEIVGRKLSIPILVPKNQRATWNPLSNNAMFFFTLMNFQQESVSMQVCSAADV